MKGVKKGPHQRGPRFVEAGSKKPAKWETCCPCSRESVLPDFEEIICLLRSSEQLVVMNHRTWFWRTTFLSDPAAGKDGSVFRGGVWLGGPLAGPQGSQVRKGYIRAWTLDGREVVKARASMSISGAEETALQGAGHDLEQVKHMPRGVAIPAVICQQPFSGVAAAVGIQGESSCGGQAKRLAGPKRGGRELHSHESHVSNRPV